MVENVITPAGPGPTLLHVADRLIGRPLLLHPAKAEAIMHVLEGRLPLGELALSPLSPEASRFAGDAQTRSGMSAVAGGVALIPVVGSLVNRGGWIGARSGATSYEGLAAQIRDAVSDRQVKAILLDIDSGGGEASGMFSLAAAIREANAEKPVTAVINDTCCSAAYGIASGAGEIVVSETSIVGSIGVLLVHIDRSGELAAKGLRPTLIHAGAHKTDGHSLGPLSDAVRADLQAEVQQFYDRFVETVAAGRGDRLTESAARATEARVFVGRAAIERGLADRIDSFEGALARLQDETKGPAGAGKKGAALAAPRQASSVGQDAAQIARMAAARQAQAPAPLPTSDQGQEAFGAIVGAAGFTVVSSEAPQLARASAGDPELASRVWAKVIAEVNGAMAPAASGPSSAPQPDQPAAAAPALPTAGSPSAVWAKAVAQANAEVGLGRQGPAVPPVAPAPAPAPQMTPATPGSGQAAEAWRRAVAKVNADLATGRVELEVRR